MNLTGLVTHIADIASLPKNDTSKAVDAVFDAITGTLAKGEEVTIKVFGTFSVTERPARTGRNPATGAAIEIPASRSPKFKAGKVLKGAVRLTR